MGVTGTTKGWFQAIYLVITWSLFNVIAWYCLVYLDIRPLVFSCVSSISASFGLLLYAGNGPLAKRTLKSLWTWAFSFVLMMNYLFEIYLMEYVTATEESLLQRLSLPLGIIFAALWFKRETKHSDIIGGVIVTIGISMLIMSVDPVVRFNVLILMFFVATGQAAQLFIAETHPQNLDAVGRNHVKDQCRVYGVIVLVVAITFLALGYVASFLSDSIGFLQHITPSYEDFTHGPTLLSGMLCGLFVVALMHFWEFSATARIKSENVLAVGSLTPIITALLSLVFGADISFSPLGWLCAITITVGAVYMAYIRWRWLYIVSGANGLKDFARKLPAMNELQALWDMSSHEEVREIVEVVRGVEFAGSKEIQQKLEDARFKMELRSMKRALVDSDTPAENALRKVMNERSDTGGNAGYTEESFTLLKNRALDERDELDSFVDYLIDTLKENTNAHLAVDSFRNRMEQRFKAFLDEVEC